MKALLICISLVLISYNLYAQSPNKMSYQAVIRNANNILLSDAPVGIRVSIIQGSVAGNVVYAELYNPNPRTNANGLVTLEIGTGIPITGVFNNIDWASGPYFMKTETDPSGGTNYSITTNKELLSVPYALFAPKGPGYSAGQGISIQNNFIALDKQNAAAGQVLKWNGTAWLPAVDSNSVSPWTLNGSNLYRNTGFVGIGNNNPGFPLDLRLSRKNGLLNVFDEAVDTSHRSPVKVGYHNSANSGISLVSIAGKTPFNYMDTSVNNPATSHIGILAGGDDFGLVATGAIGIIGTGLDAGRFYGNDLGLYCQGEQSGLIVNTRKNNIGLNVYGKTWLNNELEMFSSEPTVIFPVSYYGETNNHAGGFELFGPDGNTNVLASNLLNNPENGYVAVYNNTTPKAVMYLNSSKQGVLFADIKNFRMKHPEQPGKEIWYACIEGPEVAAYVRGTAELKDGEAVIQFSEDFRIVGNATTMTVSLTPGSPDSKGLCVYDKSANGFKVKELLIGTGNYSFDWEAKCIRKGYENYQVIREDDKELPALPQNSVRSVRKNLPSKYVR